MKIFRHAFFLAALPALLVAACAGDAPARPEPESMPKSVPAPPVAAVRPHVVESPNGNRTDEYYWLRDDTRTDTEVLAYLEAENAYTDGDDWRTRKPLEDKLYEEIVGRIKQDDSTVPYRMRGYWYYTRFETGKEYPIYARQAGTLDAPEEIMLDVNADGRGPRLLRRRRDRDQPGQQAARLGRGHGRPPPVRAARQGPRHRRRCCPIAIDERRARPRLGRRQQDASSTSRRTR